MRRNLLILAIVIGLAALGGVYYWQRQQATAQAAQAAIRSEALARGTIISTVSATGALVPTAQVNLFFGTTAPAPVTEINIALGDEVPPGAILARQDARDLALAVAQAEQALTAATLTLNGLTAPARPADLALAEANLALANAQVFAASRGQPASAVQIAYYNLVLARNALSQTYATMDKLVEQGKFAQKNALQAQADQQVQAAQIADLQYQQAKAAPKSGAAVSALASVEQAQVALDKLKNGPTAEDLQIAQLRVSQAQAALDLARNNLADADLVAPFAGLVAAVNLHVGEPASSALPAVVLVDASRFHIDVSVDEVDVARVAAGQPVTLTLDAFPNDIFSGVVEKIAPTASVNQGVVSYLVTITLDLTAVPLRGGMTATAEIIVAQTQQAVLVPNWAIRRDRATGQTYVGLLRAGQITEVEITLGLHNELFSEALTGVSVGDVVAVDTSREQISFFGGGG